MCLHCSNVCRHFEFLENLNKTHTHTQTHIQVDLDPIKTKHGIKVQDVKLPWVDQMNGEVADELVKFEK